MATKRKQIDFSRQLLPVPFLTSLYVILLVYVNLATNLPLEQLDSNISQRKNSQEDNKFLRDDNLPRNNIAHNVPVPRGQNIPREKIIPRDNNIPLENIPRNNIIPRDSNVPRKNNDPGINVPRINDPRIDVPRIDVSRINDPRIDVPRINVPRINDPRISVPRESNLQRDIFLERIQSQRSSFHLLDSILERILSPYVIGGEPAGDACRWPWLVAITYSSKDVFVCGGVLISDQYLVTAAHCFNGLPSVKDLNVLIGLYNKSANDEQQRISVSSLIIHPNYVPSAYGVNDIAMMTLSTRVNMTDTCVQPIRLPSVNYNPVGNQDCWIAGWGRFSSESQSQSDIPLQKKVSVIDNTECQLRWNNSRLSNPTISPENVCIDETNATSSCQGDSGGPLQCFDINRGGYVLVGIASWGSEACKKFPSVFMRVSSYNAWIAKEAISVQIESDINPIKSSTSGPSPAQLWTALVAGNARSTQITI